MIGIVSDCESGKAWQRIPSGIFAKTYVPQPCLKTKHYFRPNFRHTCPLFRFEYVITSDERRIFYAGDIGRDERDKHFAAAWAVYFEHYLQR